MFFARAVRQALDPLKWKQYQNCHHAHLTPGLVEALTFLVTGMLCITPRLFEVFQPVQMPTLALSDASWPDPAESKTTPPRFGWLFLEPDGAKVVSRWLPREQQVTCAEALAPLIALHHSATRLANRQVLWFVDDLGAMSSLVRESARPEDVGHNASMHTTLAAQLSAQIWYEGVDGASIPSDDLSKCGCRLPALKAEWLASSGGRARLGFFVLSVWTCVSSDLMCEVSDSITICCRVVSLCVEVYSSTVLFFRVVG